MAKINDACVALKARRCMALRVFVLKLTFLSKTLASQIGQSIESFFLQWCIILLIDNEMCEWRRFSHERIFM